MPIYWVDWEWCCLMDEGDGGGGNVHLSHWVWVKNCHKICDSTLCDTTKTVFFSSAIFLEKINIYRDQFRKTLFTTET